MSELKYDHDAEDFTGFEIREANDIVAGMDDEATYRCTCGATFDADLAAANAHLHDTHQPDQTEEES